MTKKKDLIIQELRDRLTLVRQVMTEILQNKQQTREQRLDLQDYIYFCSLQEYFSRTEAKQVSTTKIKREILKGLQAQQIELLLLNLSKFRLIKLKKKRGKIVVELNEDHAYNQNLKKQGKRNV